MAGDCSFASSRYNFSVLTEAGRLLFNARSGAVLLLGGTDGEGLVRSLCGRSQLVNLDRVSEGTLGDLLDGEFVVPKAFDELADIGKRFRAARESTPPVLTITTTMDCNLVCYYCYESRSSARLGFENVQDLVRLAHEKLSRAPCCSLHVDWYGGEPLLQEAFINEASRALIECSVDAGVRYSASLISNGTAWPDDIANFIARNRITQVQISFDGLRENHNRRRRYRSGYDRATSPFDLAVGLVDRLLDVVRVDLRINLDHDNQGDLTRFLSFATDRGWFDRTHPAILQPARLAAFSDRSTFMQRFQLSIEAFDAARGRLREAVADTNVRIEESEAPEGFPHPRTSVCAALAYHSAVVGADGLEYRCGLQVGETHRAVGTVTTRSSEREAFPDREWWNGFDPTCLPNCSRCSFLPICWGGCPKKHLEQDQHALDELSRYWRANLPRLIAQRFALSPEPGFCYSEQDQFR